MQAALVAAQRGHSVILLEKSGALGGHVTLQAKLPGLEDRSDIIRWLQLQLGKHGVDIRLDTEATPALIAELGAQAVVIATGARYARNGVSKNQLAPVPGAGLPHVLTPEDLLLDHARTGQRIVVYDNTSYEVGPGIAELLADQGKEVIFVTADSALAMSVTDIGIDKVISKRLLPRVTFFPQTVIRAIDPATVTLEHLHTGAVTELDAIDTTILVTSKPPEETLYHALIGADGESGPELHLIGDAREARWNIFATDEAIKDGRRIGLIL
jgi:thioredoxin reductase